jgi:hypothetical protein
MRVIIVKPTMFRSGSGPTRHVLPAHVHDQLAGPTTFRCVPTTRPANRAAAHIDLRAYRHQ